MRATRQEVEHIAALAKLQFDENELEGLIEQFNSILDYVGKLNELDTAHVEPSINIQNSTCFLREDEVQPSLTVEKVMQNAPDKELDYFRVPRIIT